MRSINPLKTLIVILGATGGCTLTSTSTQNKDSLLNNGYKQWSQFNIFHKPFGDTIVFFSVDKNEIILSKTIFIPVNPLDSSMNRFLGSKGYIELVANSNNGSIFFFQSEKNEKYFRLIGVTNQRFR